MQKIRPCIWLDDQAEEAMNLYCSVFPNSKPGTITRYGDSGPGTPGSVLTAELELNGVRFMLLNGGPHFQLSEAVSFVIDCKDQAEVDYYWEKLIEGGGSPSQCGWLKDKFGVSWQVVPTAIYDLIWNAEPAKAKRATEAMFKMTKLDIAALQAAHDGA